MQFVADCCALCHCEQDDEDGPAGSPVASSGGMVWAPCLASSEFVESALACYG